MFFVCLFFSASELWRYFGGISWVSKWWRGSGGVWTRHRWVTFKGIKTWPFDQATVIVTASSSVCTCKSHRLKESSQMGLQASSQADSRSDLWRKQAQELENEPDLITRASVKSVTLSELFVGSRAAMCDWNKDESSYKYVELLHNQRAVWALSPICNMRKQKKEHSTDALL